MPDIKLDSNLKIFERPRMKKNIMLLILMAVVISGCGNKQIYDNMQQDAQNECRKLPTSAYQECMQRYSESFESYTKKRSELLK